MKRIVLALSLTLASCSPQAQGLLNFATVGVANPVTPNMLYEVENGAIVVFAGLNAYKKVCVGGTIPQSCRAVIQAIQVYTRQIPPQLKVLRAYVKGNDQVNAAVVYNTISQLMASAKTTATANGVNLGG